MKKALAFHSYKGGTGKSSIAANLAVDYAIKGVNVCLFDYDFRAPSLQVLFKEPPKRWLNDFLDGKCEMKDTLLDLTEKLKTKGRLLVGLSNPSSDAMRDMMTKDRKWEALALNKTLAAKSTIYNDMEIDRIIFDTSPGVYYSSVNALAGSDMIGLVMKADEFDVEGTKQLVKGIYEVLGRKTGIILNKITDELLALEGGISNLEDHVMKTFNLPVLGVIPFHAEVLATGGRYVYSSDKPEHEFAKAISRLSAKIEQF